MKSIIDKRGYKQLINEYTRITLNSKSLIDYVVSNDFSINCEVLSTPKIADHEIIKIRLCNLENVTCHNHRVIKKINYIALSNLLNECDWQYASSDVKTYFSNFYNNIINCLNRSTEFCEKKHSKNWCNSIVYDAINNRDTAYKKFVLTKKEEDWKVYKQKRNVTTSVIRKAKENYYCDIIDNCKNNSVLMWRNLKKITNCNFKEDIDEIMLNNKSYSNLKDIVEVFNNFYIDSILNIHNSIPVINDSSKIAITFVEEIKVEELQEFTLLNITELQTSVFSQNNKSSTDNLDFKLIKDYFNIIGYPLLEFINLSLQNAVIPDELKLSIIRPIPKVSGTNKVEEFRPVNMLPACDKLLERVVYSQLVKHFNKNSLLISKQSGFRSNHSCEAVLNHLIYDWKTSLDINNVICAAFLDLQRAFETVDRSLLLDKLNKYGVKGKVLEWLTNYLQNRYQTVKVNNEISNKRLNNLGVPQGSVLGPLLFLIYINDMPNVIEHCSIHLFADDTLIYLAGEDYDDVLARVNKDLNNLFFWMNCNKLKLNVNKCKGMYLGSNWKYKHVCDSDSKMKIDSTELVIVNEIKYLGVIIDRKLKFDMYVDYLCKKISKKINYLNRITKYLSPWSTLLVYNTIILPHFTYCSTVLLMCTKNKIEQLQKLQNRAMRVILKCSKYTGIRVMLNVLQWLDIQKFIEVNVLIFIHKIIKNKMPDYFTGIINAVYTRHNYGTRQREHMIIENFNKAGTFTSIFFKGLDLYNKLPQDIKNVNSLHIFRYRLKQYYLQA